jgi:serine protease Do
MLLCPALALAVVIGSTSIHAATLEMKDANASITGEVLVEKEDIVVIDIGYTVLSVPWKAIRRIITEEANADAVAASGNAPEAATSNAGNGIYQFASEAPPVRTVRELVGIVGAGVVQVRTPGGLGSGFILNEDGFLITNFHVIEGETQISVEVYHSKSGQLERKTYKDVRIVAMNKFKDLALLKIDDEDAPKFTHVLLGDADTLAVGDRVFAVGSPLGLERTVTEGIVSTTTRQMQGELYLQTTAQINQGNSGGPLFNLRGEVIGVTNMKVISGEGLGFAIPVEAVKYFLNQRDAFAYATDNPSNPYHYLEPPSRTIQPNEKE